MNERERVIRAIRRHDTDRIPYQLDLTLGVHDKLTDYYQDGAFLYSRVGNHLIREKNKNHKHIDTRTHQDLFGVIWHQDREGGDIGTISEYFFKEPDITLYSFPEPDVNLIRGKCERIVREYNHLFKIFEIGFALFERAWTLRGMESLLMDFILNEAFVANLLDRILDYNLKVIDIAAQYPIDCIMFGDDWGQQNGLIMGPRLWQKYIRPRIAQMYERVKKHGLYVAQHSCGDNYPLFGVLIEMGLDIYNTFQPEIYDIVKFKAEFGKDLTIYGGVSTQGILSQGTPEEVRSETKRMMDVLGKNGGYIVAPTHQITTDIPLENILAFIEAVKGE